MLAKATLKHSGRPSMPLSANVHECQREIRFLSSLEFNENGRQARSVGKKANETPRTRPTGTDCARCYRGRYLELHQVSRRFARSEGRREFSLYDADRREGAAQRAAHRADMSAAEQSVDEIRVQLTERAKGKRCCRGVSERDNRRTRSNQDRPGGRREQTEGSQNSSGRIAGGEGSSGARGCEGEEGPRAGARRSPERSAGCP